jgi:carbamoyl-phosphate synthase small subunit
VSPKLPDPARLVLADGSVFRGHAFGARGIGAGEVVFNTSITGYQEILSDPSYAGQIVAMTYTQIGNVGTNPDDDESIRPFLRGFVVKEVFEPSNWRSREGLDVYMRRDRHPRARAPDSRSRRAARPTEQRPGARRGRTARARAR